MYKFLLAAALALYQLNTLAASQAPVAAYANMYLDADGNVVQGASTCGHLAVGVPGTVSGMEFARAYYGTMKLEKLIVPAIK